MNKISIIIPVYNVEDYLHRCIDSVLKQSYTQFEVLLINDGSTDSSGYICDEYSTRDPRVKVFHQKNNGVSSARNKGIRNASGDWICFLDADDWIEPDSLTRIIKLASIEKTDIIIARTFARRGGEIVRESFPFDNRLTNSSFIGLDLVIREGYVRGGVWGVLYQTRFLLTHKIEFPPKLKIGEDSIFFSLCMVYAREIRFSDLHFYNLYEREGSAFRSWTFNKLLSMVDNLEFLTEYLVNHPALPSEGIYIINYSKYGVVSSIYNHFNLTFSVKNYFTLRKRIRSTLGDGIQIGNIKTNYKKVKILNLSLDLFALSVLIKSKISKILLS